LKYEPDVLATKLREGCRRYRGQVVVEIEVLYAFPNARILHRVKVPRA
jgi:hypothetical protein